MELGVPSIAAATAFAAGVAALRQALAGANRTGLLLTEVGAPKRMAPYAVAVTAQVQVQGAVVATGRFVVLHDPQGQPGWGGLTRVVALVQADTDPEMAGDAALGAVGWAWLTDALDQRGAGYTAAAGTVTRTVSSRFGDLGGDDPVEHSEVEIRASWTPTGPDGELGRHLWAWCDLLCATAGLPPRVGDASPYGC